VEQRISPSLKEYEEEERKRNSPITTQSTGRLNNEIRTTTNSSEGSSNSPDLPNVLPPISSLSHRQHTTRPGAVQLNISTWNVNNFGCGERRSRIIETVGGLVIRNNLSVLMLQETGIQDHETYIQKQIEKGLEFITGSDYS